MNRRNFLAASALAVGAAVPAARAQPAASVSNKAPTPVTGRLKHSVCRWCFSGMPLEELCGHAKDLGIASVELLGENEWSVPAAFGLTCAVANGPTTIARGFNRTEHHDAFVQESERLLPLIKAANIPNMIVFSGNRAGLDDATGLKNSASGLKRITALAESLGVTIVMELLNSKIDHGDYMCDRTPWGVNLVNEVASPRFKLLYDIYHMQIMEGDVIRTITDHSAAIAHYHTAGVPGRREIDDSQELYYPAICRAIADTGFTGYLAQEFIPSKDAVTSLRRAIEICTV